jgi:AraC family transcriptional regulator
MSTNPLATKLASRVYFGGTSGSPPSAALVSIDNRLYLSRQHEEPNNRYDRQSDGIAVAATEPTVEIFPRNVAKRRATSWDGMTAEIIQTTSRERIDFRFRAPLHLLVVAEQGVRTAGETLVEGLPRSTLRDLRRKLTFVPAGHEYHEWQEPRVLSRATYFYFDPVKLPVDPQLGRAETLLAPRLFFEDAALWETARKLRTLIENPRADNQPYLDALGMVLAHELVRLNVGAPRAEPQIRGGLAAWQQRNLAEYIEENLAEPIPLAALAQLVNLSPHHFCRAFKQSFGMPPHRYHTSRRIERAKALLAKPAYSVTDIGMTVGFSETSSFSAAFRKATGLTPTAYHRGLD